MKLRVSITTSLIAVLISVMSAAAQDTTLRYRWTKGDEVRYRLIQQGTTTISGMPGMGDVSSDQNVTQVLTLKVDEVAADGSATIRQTFESIRMEVTAPGVSFTYDSASPTKATGPMAAMGTSMGAMVGESITVVMQPNGAVTKVEGMSRIFEKAMKGLPQDPATAQVMEQFKTSMGDDGIRSMFQQGFASLPDRAVKAGESWTGQLQMANPMLGAMTTTTTSTFKGLESNGGTSIARIGLTLAMKQDPNAAPAGPMGMAMKMGDATSNGEILFDVTKGRVQKTVMTGVTPISMSMTGPDGTAMNMNTVVRNTMTMEIVVK